MSIIEDDTERYKHLLSNLTKAYAYSPSALLLFRQVTHFITTVVQDDKCKRKKPHDTHLHDLLCHFSMAYVPIPMERDLRKHGELVNSSPVIGEGSNGRVYGSGLFEGNPIVTKTKKKWSNHTIYDIYINFVVLNSFLLQNTLVHHLIPSYGMFLCSTNEDGTEICLPPKKQEHLFLVQKKLDGDTVSTHLPYMTLIQYTAMFKELMRALISLEQSPYQLYHTDLHCGNVMIQSGSDGVLHPVLLDFELCSFTVQDESGQPHRYRLNSLENKYCGKEQIMSGGHDLILFLAHTCVITKSVNPHIHKLTLAHLQTLFQNFWIKKNKGFTVTPGMFYKSTQRWIFQLLMDAEEKLSGKEKEEVHRHNMEELKTMTYASIYQRLNI